MSKLVFKKLLIADIANNVAKCVEFKDGKNLLTSSSNHLGKSLVCKSLYHVLGADALFSDNWKKVNSLYSLEFSLNGKDYRITRKDYIFNIYDSSGNKLKFFKIKNLIGELNRLFNFTIMLISRHGETSFKASYPMYTYMPYYIDQENGWTAKAESFANLTTLDKAQRINSLFYHLGCFDDSYVECELRLKHTREKKIEKEKQWTQCRNIIEYMQDFIDKNGDLVSDEEELNKRIFDNRGRLNSSLGELEKLRIEIINVENEKAVLIKEKEAIVSFMKKEKRAETDVIDVSCPKCEHVFSVGFKERFRKEYLLETINEDLSRVVTSITKLDEKLGDRNHKFVNVRNGLKYLERTIVSDVDLYNLYIKVKSARAMIDDNRKMIGELDMEIKELDKEIKSMVDSLKVFRDRKDDANSCYRRHLSTMFSNLNVSTSELLPEAYDIGAEISLSGAYQERAVLSKYYAFLQTKRQLADDIIKFPLVIDSPKGSEQSKENSKKIMDFVFTDNSLDNQIIVATIDGKEYLPEGSQVNVIELSNQPHSLLTSECYQENEKLIRQILLDFA